MPDAEMTDAEIDIVGILRDYQRWMRDGIDGGPSIDIEDIDGDETFGAAADLLESQDALLREAVELMRTIDRPLLQQGSWSEVRERARAVLAKLEARK